jgi:hypothetical protein
MAFLPVRNKEKPYANLGYHLGRPFLYTFLAFIYFLENMLHLRL